MLFRKIFSELERFFTENPKEALLITGARQIGKSFVIREFGKSHFENFVEINFIESPQAIEAFNNARNVQDIILRITALTNQTIKKGKTLIFFDEVQKCPEIITALKFLVEDGSYRYILSGSLLGIALKGIRSIPVGFMTIKEMYPMDLEEFFIACGVQPQIFESLKQCFEQKTAVDSFVHDKMMQLFRLYMIIGGMPAVVQTYIDTNNIQSLLAVQKSIIQMYREDISQYDPQNKLYIQDIFDLIPAELNSQNKRFILKKLNENLKFSRYEDSFIWLREAGVALPVYNIESPTQPLELAKQRNLFKLFSNDSGLLASQYAQGIQLKILNNDNAINYGAIFENTVAQELKAHGFKLFYFNSKKQGELDFVIKVDDDIVPIEVKSGKEYERHNALKNVISNPDYDIKKAYVLCNENLKVSGKITYLPIYMMMFIKNSILPDFIYKVDLLENSGDYSF